MSSSCPAGRPSRRAEMRAPNRRAADGHAQKIGEGDAAAVATRFDENRHRGTTTRCGSRGSAVRGRRDLLRPRVRVITPRRSTRPLCCCGGVARRATHVFGRAPPPHRRAVHSPARHSRPHDLLLGRPAIAIRSVRPVVEQGGPRYRERGHVVDRRRPCGLISARRG